MKFNFKEILGYLAGMTGQEEPVTVRWTNGNRKYGEYWIRGLAVDAQANILGVITLSFDRDLGNFAEIKVKDGNKVKTAILEYRGAWLWPLEELVQLRRPLEERGRKVPELTPPAQGKSRRPRIVRRVVREVA